MSVKLTHTFAEFLEQQGLVSPPTVFFAPNASSYEDLSKVLRRNEKYLITQWNRNSKRAHWIHNMVLNPMRNSWMMGGLPVLVLAPDVDDNVGQSILQTTIEETLSVVELKQRFKAVVCKSWEDVACAVQGTRVLPYLPLDQLATMADHYISPDRHYLLLLKRTLALSGLPTPETRVIDLDRTDVENSIRTALSAVRDRELPFVLKTNYSACSRGTFIIHTEAQRSRIMRLAEEQLPVDMARCNALNAHLHPCSLILSEWIQGDTTSINFYVGQDGNSIFSSATQQEIGLEGYWEGGVILYSTQTEKRIKLSPIIAEVSAYLHSQGYHGPVGIDVMSHVDGRMLVVDLNPRPSGSFILGCLTPHFSDQLHLDAAKIIGHVVFKSTQADFRQFFQVELEQKVVIPLAWCFDPADAQTHTSLAIAAADLTALSELEHRIISWTKLPFEV